MFKKILIIILFALLVVGWTLYFNSYCNPPNIEVKSDTVVTTRVDTIWNDTIIEKTKYIPKKVEIIRTDTITKDTILTTEQKIYEDTLCNDKDSIILQSFISGISSKLDSTSVNWKKHTTVVTNTVEVTKYIEKPKTFLDRIHIQPQITSGYDLVNHQWGITAGIGFGIDL